MPVAEVDEFGSGALVVEDAIQQELAVMLEEFVFAPYVPLSSEELQGVLVLESELLYSVGVVWLDILGELLGKFMVFSGFGFVLALEVLELGSVGITERCQVQYFFVLLHGGLSVLFVELVLLELVAEDLEVVSALF